MGISEKERTAEERSRETERLLEQFPTPLYVFDSGSLKERVEYLRRHLPRGIRLCYAMKANSFVLKELEELVDGFEVCSPGEADICKKSGVEDSMLVISGVYKSAEYIESLLRERPRIGMYTVESMEQYRYFCRAAEKYKKTVPVLLRLTSGNQFGVNPQEIRDIIRENHPGLHIRGIQFFSGTQKLSIRRLKRELQMVDAFLSGLREDCGFVPEMLEFGPGFPVTYFEQDEYQEEEFLAEFSKLLTEMENQVPVTLELGRSIAAACGTYYTRVVDTKTNRRARYAIVDGGMHHLVYYSQTMAMKIPLHEIYPLRGEREEKSWNICGSLCTINDIFVKQLPAADLKIGDVIAFQRAGAYCMTEGISLFLSHKLPRVVLKERSGEYRLLRPATDTSPFNMSAEHNQ